MEEKNEAERYWDRNVGASNLPGDGPIGAAGWPEEVAFYMTPEQEFAYRALGELRGRLVLEIGSGVGVNAANLARKGARVVALDSSLPRLKALKRLGSELGLAASLHPVCARAEALPFREGAFDGAYSKATLIHTDLHRALEECRRVLHRGGRGVFCEPTTSNPFACIYRRLLGPREWRSITRYFSKNEESEIAAVFGRVRGESFYFLSFLAFYWQFGRRNLKRFKRHLAALFALDRLLFSIIPPLRRLAWFKVHVVEKTGAAGNDRSAEQ